ncbi:hypothetical protein NPIL_423511 [Nephila pilipes]|uniref:Uncharacterized protein n=1 Tax=Nephila pilipes TaxID=299642 RepID=A0A8X6QVA5_NEPPI|nr:hypothetical protein NPIL_423511 [Nephila pilipes]
MPQQKPPVASWWGETGLKVSCEAVHCDESLSLFAASGGSAFTGIQTLEDFNLSTVGETATKSPHLFLAVPFSQLGRKLSSCLFWAIQREYISFPWFGEAAAL